VACEDFDACVHVPLYSACMEAGRRVVREVVRMACAHVCAHVPFYTTCMDAGRCIVHEGVFGDVEVVVGCRDVVLAVWRWWLAMPGRGRRS